MAVHISSDDLKNLKKLIAPGHNNGGSIYIKDDETLYKILNDSDYCFHNETLRNILFLINTSVRHSSKPEEEIFLDGTFNGYKYKYIKDSTTFKSEMQTRSLSFSERINAVSNVFDALRDIHSKDPNVNLGDIHLDNFLVDKNGNGFLIDMDNLRFLGDEFLFFTYYLLKLKKDTPAVRMENQHTDNIKTGISALSFIYGIDFETLVKNGTIEDLEKCLSYLDIKNQEQVKKVLENFDGRITYFDDCLPFISSDNYDNDRLSLIIKK